MQVKKRFLHGLLLLLVMAMTLTACTVGPATTAGTTAAPTQATTTVAPEPMGMYETPLTIHVVAPTDSTVKYREGESAQNNAWITAYKEKLGIDIQYDWIVDSAQYTTKLNLSITSG